MPIKTFVAGLLTYADVNTYLMQQMVDICTAATRPASPVSGQHVWQTDTNTEHIWDGSAWQFLRGIDRVARKTSDETVNNSSTLQNDDVLVVSVEANAVYRVECQIICSSSTTADIKTTFTVPAGATLRWGTYAPHRSVSSTTASTISANVFSAAGVADVGGYGTSTNVLYVLRGILRMSSTAGSLQFQWAQSTADATNTTVRAGSVLHARRLA